MKISNELIEVIRNMQPPINDEPAFSNGYDSALDDVVDLLEALQTCDPMFESDGTCNVLGGK